MNQLLKPELNIIEKKVYDNYMDERNETKRTKNTHKSSSSNRFYLFQFLFSCLTAICFLMFFFIRAFYLNKKSSISDELLKTYQIATLYANSTDYSTQQLQAEIYHGTTPFVIGMIKIDKINLNYPILSQSSKELLNISVCRFAGPMPNEIGNLCIAGHNYVDYKFFSRLHELEKGDKIKLYDLNGQMKEYVISRKYETKADDISCTSQNTNGKVLLTLLTCNNVSGKRLVLVAS